MLSSPIERPRGCAPASRQRVCFLYIAQAHQILHSISAALELARRRPDVVVEAAFTQQETLDYARLLVDLLGGAPIVWRLLGPPWLRATKAGGAAPAKLPLLVANRHLFAGYDVIVAPERTTALLRQLGVRKPKLVYTQHGAGDRAGPFEPRLGRFDMVFAAGSKQRERMLRQRLVRPERCAVVGYPKFDLIDRLDPPLPRLFPDRRPLVLYNPHFDAELSSWPLWGPRILAAFARQDRYNLIFAPHLRLFRGRKPGEVPALAPFVGHPRIHMDLGAAAAAVDMSYTRLADLYVGDVSSQVYEFIRKPRPCLFLNAHRCCWRGDESFGHWKFGPVHDRLDEVLPAIEDAFERFPDYRLPQEEGFARTFSETEVPASVRAANAIGLLLGAPPTTDAGEHRETPRDRAAAVVRASG